MEKINRILVLLVIIAFGQYAMAQPPARKQEQNKSKSNETQVYEVPLSERAKSQYPKTETPEDVVWKRDVYRTLDLQKEKNASLYYPVQPIGKSMNLFTYIFRHILDNSITAYDYNIDGYENFTEDHKVEPRELLENHGIYYEFTEDSALVVNPSDMPTNEVLSYYIKESHYYDQRTSTYNHRVVAICPVLHRTGEYGNETTKFPLFWLKYDEIAPLLSLQTVMSSSYNNVSTMSLDDYFTKHCYEGEIYKTVNLRNLAINQYCKDSVAVKKEQAKIEGELEAFRKGLWNTPQPKLEATTDSIATDSIATPKEEKSKEKKSTRTTRKKKENTEKAKKEKSKSSGSPSTKVSVRRQRR